MTTFPTYVTHAQMKAVCDILGLPGELIRTLTLDASEGLTATAYVLKDGKKLAVGPDGEAATTIVRAPVGPDRAPAPGGEEGCTVHPAGGDIGIHFDVSPETLQRLRDALRRMPGQP